MIGIPHIWKQLEQLVWADPDVVQHAAKVMVWGRWFIFLISIFLLACRPGPWYPDDIEHAILQVPLVVFNGLVHHRLLTNRPVTWRWMLSLSALDIALITTHAVVVGGLDNLIFLACYPALGAFAVVFSSFSLIMMWTTMVAAVYALVSVVVGPGLDLVAGEERVLVARLAVMYLIVVGINLIVRSERERRQAATARERRMQQERIDLSQTIHDTTAQTAYVINLGIDGAIKLAEGSNPQLVERLENIATLSRSAMWELRSPIDMGQILEGRELGRVLWSHTETFARITSIPVEMEQSGEEPPLAMEVRTGLFAIAHNALANAFLHAQAGRVDVGLAFEADSIRLSVSDNGIGLPEDYAQRGRGFSGMEADAQRMGGRLIVETGNAQGGTTISCVVPRQQGGKGD